MTIVNQQNDALTPKERIFGHARTVAPAYMGRTLQLLYHVEGLGQ